MKRVLLSVLVLLTVSIAQSDPPPSRFTVDNQTSHPQVVHDNVTGLYWYKDAHPTAVTHAQALTECTTNIGIGYRLPTLKELASLYDVKTTAGLPSTPSAFTDRTSGRERYWSSTQVRATAGTYYVFIPELQHLANELIATDVDTNLNYALCVRDTAP